MNVQSSPEPKPQWRWRFLRWGSIALAVLATAMAVLITEENWRGKRDWEKFRQAAAARGEQLDLFDSSTNPVSDDQNFAKAPVFSSLWAMQWNEQEQAWQRVNTNIVDRLKMRTTRSDGSSPKKAAGDWNRAALVDLKTWQEYYRTPPAGLAGEFPIAAGPQSPAADILLALGKYDAPIEELRVDSQRPYSRFSTEDGYDSKSVSRLLTYLSNFKACFSVIQLRALAELADGQTDKGFDDVTLLLRLNDKLRQEPLLIAHLVSLATMSLSMQPIYEGLVRHQWSGAQLAGLEKALAAKDFLADYHKAMRGERAFAISSLENMRLTREYKVMDNSSGGNKIRTVSMHLMPAAFFYQNEMAGCRVTEQYELPLIDLNQRTVSPSALHRAEFAVRGEMSHYQPYRMWALMNFPAASLSVRKFAEAQCHADLAQVACALERWRLAEGTYPETLAALAPQYLENLPHDIINGQPLNYRRTEGGHFILYSVAWNEKDDGGQVVLTKTGLIDREKGDWVWNSAAK